MRMQMILGTVLYHVQYSQGWMVQGWSPERPALIFTRNPHRFFCKVLEDWQEAANSPDNLDRMTT